MPLAAAPIIAPIIPATLMNNLLAAWSYQRTPMFGASNQSPGSGFFVSLARRELIIKKTQKKLRKV
jgi:hypothetical protein